MENEIKCLKCGQCCYYIIPYSDGKVKKCKYLGYLRKSEVYYCKRWSDRNSALKHGWAFKIATYLDPDDERIKPVVCVERKYSNYNYPGCPFNKLYPDKEIAPWLKQKKK